MTCSKCFTELNCHHAVTDGTTPSEGDILLCGHCGTVNEMRDGALRAMTVEEIKRLAPEEQRDLDFAIRNIQSAVRHSRRGLRPN